MIRLNLGQKISLRPSIELDVRTITGIKTFHLGKKASFVVNQREGLKGLCLRLGQTLLNVSENLSMAFFWPKNPTDLERVEDKDLSNGTQVLVSYPESSMSLDLGTADLKENILPLYKETGEKERADIVKQIEDLYEDKFAITTLYDTEEKAQELSAFKFDHWRQFRQTSYIQYEFCFKPVFKLDRVHKKVETNFGNDVDDVIDSYSENPDKGVYDNYPGGIGSWVTQIPGVPVVNHHGTSTSDRIQLQKIIRNEQLGPQTVSKGVIPTFTYKQVGYREEWYYEWHTGGVIHYCSHPIYYPQYTLGRDWCSTCGHGWYTYTGKSRGSTSESSFVDPALTDAWDKAHPTSTLFYIFDEMIYNHSHFSGKGFVKLETTNAGRGNDPRVYDITANHFKSDLEASSSQFDYHVWCDGNEIVFDRNKSYSPVSLEIGTVYNNNAIGYVEDRTFTTYYKMASCRIRTVYFKVIDESIDPSDVSQATFEEYMQRGQIEIVDVQMLAEKALNPMYDGSSFEYDYQNHHIVLTAENDSTFDSYVKAFNSCYNTLNDNFQRDYFNYDYDVTEGTKVIVPEACLSLFGAGGQYYKGIYELYKLGSLNYKNDNPSTSVYCVPTPIIATDKKTIIATVQNPNRSGYLDPISNLFPSGCKYSQFDVSYNHTVLPNGGSTGAFFQASSLQDILKWTGGKMPNYHSNEAKLAVVDMYEYHNYYQFNGTFYIKKYVILDKSISKDMVTSANYDSLIEDGKIRELSSVAQDMSQIQKSGDKWVYRHGIQYTWGIDIPFDSDLGKEISNYYNNVLYPDMLKAKGASITVSVPRSKIPTPYVLVLGYNGNPNDSRIAEAARSGSGVAKLNTYVLYTELIEYY